MLVDPNSYELAEHFLPDGAAKDAVQCLAEVIQQAIEDHLSTIESEAAEREVVKHAPTISSDCRYLRHGECTGEESALWPDGETTMRPCSCPCHTSL